MKHTLLLAALGLTLSAGAQKVTNQVRFAKGQKLEMVTKANTVTSMDMMGQAMEVKMDATITRHFDVEDATTNSAVIEHKVKRLQFNVEAPMAGTQSFDSENEKDMQGEMGKTVEKSIKNKYKMTVDAAGRVTAVKSDDDNPNKPTDKGNSNDMMASALSQMGSGLEMPKVGDSTEFLILPAGDVTKGQSWKKTAGTLTTTYTVSDINDAAVLVDFVEEGKTTRNQEANSMELTINTNNKTTGKITIDRKTGLLKESSSTIDSEGSMDMMGQSIPLKVTGTKVVTVK